MRHLSAVPEVCAQVILTITGYLRPRPAPALECALRAAFASLDSDLAAILDGRYQAPPRDVWTTSRRLSFTSGQLPGHGVCVAS